MKERKAMVPWREGGLITERSEGERERVRKREHVGFIQEAVVWGSPGSHWERTLPFLKYI